MTKYILLAVFIVMTYPAMACNPRPWTNERQYKESDAIYIGIVSSLSMPAIEQGNDIKYADVIYRVVISETLKGKPIKILEFPANWCRGGSARLGYEAIVVKGGYDDWYISNTEVVIDEFRAIHRRENP